MAHKIQNISSSDALEPTSRNKINEGFNAVDIGLKDTQWLSPTYVSATSFTVSENVTAEATKGRILKITFTTSGVKICTIQSAFYNSSTDKTTITVSGEPLANEAIESVEVDLSPTIDHSKAQKICADPVNDYDTINKRSAINKDGSVPFTADQSFGSHKATNLADPTSAQDAVTKNYVDPHIQNLLINGGFDDDDGRDEIVDIANDTFTQFHGWKFQKGGTTAPTVNIAKETTTKETNSKQSCKISITTAGSSSPYARVIQIIENWQEFQGKKISLQGSVNTATADKVRLFIDDGVNKTYSAYHTGGGVFIKLKVEDFTISTSATKLEVGIEIVSDATITVYVDNMMLVPGSVSVDYTPYDPVTFNANIKNFAYLRLQKTSDQTVTSGTEPSVVWNVKRQEKNGEVFSWTANDSRITINKPGIYSVTVVLRGDVFGGSWVSFIGFSKPYSVRCQQVYNSGTISFIFLDPASIEVYVYQNSGSNKTINGSSTSHSASHISIAKIG